MPRKFDYSKEFEKDWGKLINSGKQDMQRFKEGMMLLVANEEILPAEWKDHQLNGKWDGYRECHVKGDLLLIYIVRDDGSVTFARAGTHSALFQ